MYGSVKTGNRPVTDTLYFLIVLGGGGGRSSVSHSTEFKEGKRSCWDRTGTAGAFGGWGIVLLPCAVRGSSASSSRAIDCIECDNDRNSWVLELLHILQDSLNCESIPASSL
jgi:hypothetical protein